MHITFPFHETVRDLRGSQIPSDFEMDRAPTLRLGSFDSVSADSPWGASGAPVTLKLALEPLFPHTGNFHMCEVALQWLKQLTSTGGDLGGTADCGLPMPVKDALATLKELTGLDAELENARADSEKRLAAARKTAETSYQKALEKADSMEHEMATEFLKARKRVLEQWAGKHQEKIEKEVNQVGVARKEVCSRLDEHVKGLVHAVCEERRREQRTRTESHQATIADYDTLVSELENDLQLSIDAESTRSVASSTPSPPSLAGDVEELQRMILEKMKLSPGHVADEISGKLAYAIKQVMGQDFCQTTAFEFRWGLSFRCFPHAW